MAACVSVQSSILHYELDKVSAGDHQSERDAATQGVRNVPKGTTERVAESVKARATGRVGLEHGRLQSSADCLVEGGRVRAREREGERMIEELGEELLRDRGGLVVAVVVRVAERRQTSASVGGPCTDPATRTYCWYERVFILLP